MESKRRLPVVNSPAAEEPTYRQPWQWVGFGALAIVTVWVPLSAVAGWIATGVAARAQAEDPSRLARAGAAIALAYFAALGFGAILGGFVVGRWGTPGVGLRHAALSGLSAAAVALGATWIAFGFSAPTLLLAGVAPAMAAWGGRAGMRRRGR